jgi:PBP1b-binding outer membrane lipoprotein LpoB
MTIIKALQAIETIKINNKTPRTVMIHTDTRVIMESLKNKKNGHHLIEEIKKKTTAVEKENWSIEYTWLKRHTQVTMEMSTLTNSLRGPLETKTYATTKSQKVKYSTKKERIA